MERRRTGDRGAIAKAVAEHAETIREVYFDPARAIALLDEAWAEFSDLEETPAGVELMSAFASSYRGLDDMAASMAWQDRLMPIAERLGLLEATARGIMGRGYGMLTGGRPREGIVLLQGAHQLAVANDLRDIEQNARILMTFYEQWSEPAAGLALAREGLEIGRRIGSRSYGFQMVGNGCVCALRAGEWEWTAALLDEWLAIESTTSQRFEFFVDRAILRALRGEDATSDIDEAARLRIEGGITDPQWESYELWAAAWSAFAAGHHADVRRLGERAVEMTSYFAPLVYPLVIRSALWSGDTPGAAAALASLEASGYLGPALTADRTLARAGIDALEGRGPEALAGYREALRSYRQLGLVFEEAAATVDMATLLPPAERDAPDVTAAIAAAGETLRRLGARPFLARLEETRAKQPAG